MHTTTNAGSITNLLEDLIEAAGKAPSPDNNQPWLFRFGSERIDVLHRRERALPSDVGDMFSWIAIGAALENLALAASVRHLAAQIEYQARPFEQSAECEHIATIRFQEGAAPDPLHAYLDDRTTNRRLYGRKPLTEREKSVLTDVVAETENELFWLSDRIGMRQLGQIIALIDRIRFEHRPFHEEFHSTLRFNEEEARRRGDGLSLKSLEIPAVAAPLMRGLRHWKRMHWANRFGMSRLFARYSVRQVHSSSAVGFLIAPDRNDGSYLESGRLLQRIWLTATQQGLAMQPMGALPLFFTKLAVHGRDAFLPEHARRLNAILGPFYDLFPGAADKVPVMLFRIGRAKPPSARSYRYPPKTITLQSDFA